MVPSEEEEKEYLRTEVWGKDPIDLQFQIALIDNDDIEFVPYSTGRWDSPEE